jgi:hypothetical protein
VADALPQADGMNDEGDGGLERRVSIVDALLANGD